MSKLLDEIDEKQKNFLKNISTKMDPRDNNYFCELEDNLIIPMCDEHREQYEGGSGSELKEGKNHGKLLPPKMKCVHSSSAMAFNLLGNQDVSFTENRYFIIPGNYSIEYEKQMKSLTGRGSPANLDAFLSNEEKRTAIFCEMKMVEWLEKPDQDLNPAYSEKDRYFYEDSYKYFENWIKTMKENTAHERYDRWQMFRHTLGIFNATCREDNNSGVNQFKDKFDKITLINVVYMPDAKQFNERQQKRYIKMVKEEREGFDTFRKIMLDSGIKKLFDEKCGVDFDIDFITAHDFINCMEKTNAEKKYLERYWKL